MPDDALKKIGFLLIDGFALMSYASIMEPFRAANVLVGRDLYHWSHIVEAGSFARASNGMVLQADHELEDDLAYDILFVCAGGNATSFNGRTVLNWLRRMARRCAHIGGVSAGPFILARAGLLDGYLCTVHWEHMPAFTESYPHLRMEGGLYVMDRSRLTCAGGIAALDLAIEVIAQDHGPELAAAVGEWYIRAEPRTGSGAQRLSLRERYGCRNDKVLTVLAHMEANLESPASRVELAAVAGISVRQLERLFATHLQRTVAEQYRTFRLDHAKRLLRQSSLPVTQVAIASGFSSASHFSRSFRRRFGQSPSRFDRRNN